MSVVWQVQEAKNRFREMIDRALNEGPQTVTRHGKPVVRVVAVSDERAALVESTRDDGLLEFLPSAPRVEGFAEWIGERSSIQSIGPLGK